MAEYIAKERVIEEIEGMDNCGCITRSVNHVCEDIRSIPPADVIPIPKGATNGDVIKAMFPDELLTSITSALWWGDNMSFNKDWWNAPYKGVK